MSTASTIDPAMQPHLTRSLGALATIYVKETRYEFLKLLRTRQFSLATIGFPVMFYVLFGLSNRRVVDGDVHVATYLLGGYACFGLIGAALFGIGVGMAGEINAGWLELKRASPMPPAAYLFAKCMTAIAFGIVIVSILIALGVTMGGVSIGPSEMARMMGLSVAGSVTFASMGLLLAQIVPANAAPGIVNLIYLPMSFLSGLWIPLSQLPRWVRRIAPVLPTYHLSQLMVGTFGRGYADREPVYIHWLGLVAFTALMLGASWAVFSRRQQEA